MKGGYCVLYIYTWEKSFFPDILVFKANRLNSIVAERTRTAGLKVFNPNKYFTIYVKLIDQWWFIHGSVTLRQMLLLQIIFAFGLYTTVAEAGQFFPTQCINIQL